MWLLYIVINNVLFLFEESGPALRWDCIIEKKKTVIKAVEKNNLAGEAPLIYLPASANQDIYL